MHSEAGRSQVIVWGYCIIIQIIIQNLYSAQIQASSSQRLESVALDVEINKTKQTKITLQQKQNVELEQNK